MTGSFVPRNFNIPETLETDAFKLRMLKATDVDKDFEAVMTSVDHLQGVFGEDSRWPSRDLTREQDLKDLEWHEEEFRKKSSFTYTVMSLDETLCLGCVYIFPFKSPDFEADVYRWVRKSEFDKGLDPILYQTVKQWINERWPFRKVRYPGRE